VSDVYVVGYGEEREREREREKIRDGEIQ